MFYDNICILLHQAKSYGHKSETTNQALGFLRQGLTM